MKIVDKRKRNVCLFKDLTYGDWFLWHDMLYVKLESTSFDFEAASVEENNAYLTRVDGNAVVEKVDVEITLNASI